MYDMSLAHNKSMEFAEEIKDVIYSCRFEIDDIKKLKPNYDISSLERDLHIIHPERRECYINSILLSEIATKITPEFEIINQSKANAKTPEDFIRTMDAEKELCNKAMMEYPSLNLDIAAKGIGYAANDQIARAMLFHDERRYFTEELMSHVHVIEKENIWPSNQLLEFLRNETSSCNYNVMESKLHHICKDHLVSSMIDDVHHIEVHGFADRLGKRFECQKEYLEHRLNDKDHSHYLHGTVAHSMLYDVHRGKALDLEAARHIHTEQMQTAKFEHHTHTKTQEMEIHKDYGKGM
nr:hypothetical protein [Rickettsiaceae bacterium]